MNNPFFRLPLPDFLGQISNILVSSQGPSEMVKNRNLTEILMGFGEAKEGRIKAVLKWGRRIRKKIFFNILEIFS